MGDRIEHVLLLQLRTDKQTHQKITCSGGGAELLVQNGRFCHFLHEPLVMGIGLIEPRALSQLYTTEQNGQLGTELGPNFVSSRLAVQSCENGN